MRVLQIRSYFPDARFLMKLNNKIWKHGQVLSEMYRLSPDKNQVCRPHRAVHIVQTDARGIKNLKNTFAQLRHQYTGYKFELLEI